MHLRMVFVSPDIATVRIVVEISSIHSTIISVNFGPTGKISKKSVHLLRRTFFSVGPV